VSINPGQDFQEEEMVLPHKTEFKVDGEDSSAPSNGAVKPAFQRVE
jgi:hypothetical protein